MNRLIVTFAVAVVLVGVREANAAFWEISQLTDNRYADEAPCISGANVVWTGRDSGYQILFYDGSTTTKIASDSRGLYDVGASGSNVAWKGYGGVDFEIFVHDADTHTTTQVTNDGYTDQDPWLAGSNVVWQGHPAYSGVDFEILLYNAITKTTTRLTDNSEHEEEPRVSGSNVVWRGRTGGSSSDFEIFFYDGTTAQVTDNEVDDRYPQISGSNVVWEMNDGHDQEIFFYDALTKTTTQLTDNEYGDFHPQVSGSNVVWYDWDGKNNDVFLYNAITKTTTQLTSGSFNKYTNPKVSGSYVVWARNRGAGYNRELLVYDGSSITQLANNLCEFGGFDLDGSTVVWQGWDGHDWEIFEARAIPEPASVIVWFLLGALGMTVAWLRKRAA
ncbi:MAG TPA: hypothetical protein VMY37_27600 [Thermoguttaceae bacterium]|nr:hypothetical protein [Thermoguttaceae bacterium]